ncbi:MAG: sialidase family protein [Lachnospiraceae bacterium]|nr:sialidase family protein [Lachnospiraceae bacterium]
MSEWKKSRKFVAAVLLITMLFSQSASVWAVDTSVGSVSANTLSDDIETNEKNDVSSPEEATTQADSASAGDFSSGKDHTVESEDSISDNTTSPSDDSQRTDAVLANSITQTVSENIVEETDESVSNNSVSANTVSANTVSTFRLAAPLVQPVAGGGQPLTTLDENSVYWIYSVADNGGGTYAPHEDRILWDNGNTQGIKSGYLQTTDTIYNGLVNDTAKYNRRYSKSSWQFEAADSASGKYYLQNGYSHAYATANTNADDAVTTANTDQRETFIINIIETGADGKYYVSIQSATRAEQGQASYLKAADTTTSGDAAVSVTFADTADKTKGTLWCIEEPPGHAIHPNATYLWRTSRGNHYFRIPAIATVNNGNVLAVSDLRYDQGGDLGNHEIDLLRRIRSYDAATASYGDWGNESNLTQNYRNANEGYGDTALVADRESDEVLIVAAYGSAGYGSNSIKAARILSTDGGESFQTAVNISDQIYTKISPSTSFFFTSGRIMQSRYVKVGTHYRIYSAILACNGNTSNNINYVLYSDDFGITWDVLGGTSVIEKTDNNNKADEAKIEELPNGDVLISSRNSNNPGRYINVFSYDSNPDGTKNYASGSWETSKTKLSFEGGNITSQGTNGELLMLYAKKSDGTYTHLLLHSLPSSQAAISSGSHTGRKSVTVWYKELDAPAVTPDISASDVANTWKKGMVIQDSFSAYSTMTIQADGKIGFFYEDSLTWYDMVYYSLSVDQITGGGGTYTEAFKGIGSKTTPYVVDNEERAAAYRDVFGEEQVNWEFSEEALIKLATEYNDSSTSHPDGEMLAVAWNHVKDSQDSMILGNTVTKDELVQTIQKKAAEKDSRIVVTAQGDMSLTPAVSGSVGSAEITVKIACGNTIGYLKVTLPVNLNDQEKLQTASRAVQDYLVSVTADNNTDKSALLAQLQNAVNAAVGSNDVSLSWDSFTKKAATAGVAGAITSTLKLSCGTESDKIDWNPSIAALPLPGATDKEKVAMAVQAVKNALKTVTADNNTDKSALLTQLQNAVNAAVGSNDVS